jgi:N-acetyl-anhydromuramyl-L-alanine amidase AmpD
MMRLVKAALFAIAALGACVGQPAPPQTSRISVGGDSPLARTFVRVGTDTGVPPALLAAVSWVETRFSFANAPRNDHNAGSLGLMGLTDGGSRDLTRGAMLAGVTDHAARTEIEASIRAGAALLQTPGARSIGDFTPALRAFGGDGFANAVEQALARGIDGRDEAGLSITIAAQPEVDSPGFTTITQGLGYPGAAWVPASTSNYQTANRGLADIDHIIIHDTEGSYDGTVSWFKNPAAQVSAHYLLRSTDGFVAQMVDEKNIAWHIKCLNTRTVGIEHEGFAANPGKWYTEVMYAESAKLTAYLADKYSIQKAHGPIEGHGEAPDCSTHTDPGPGWDWAHYIDLVQTGGAGNFAADSLTVDAPASIKSGEIATVTVTVTNHGTSAWDLDATRVGTQSPQDRDSALFVDGDWIGPNRATAVDVRTAAGAVGTFTFQIQGPAVTEPVVYDEAFQLVQEGVAWFGPTFNVVVQVTPEVATNPSGGCNAARGSGSGGVACVMLALGATVRRRRRR